MQLLQHITVTEFAGAVPARYAGRLLADLGAVVRFNDDRGSLRTDELLSKYLSANKVEASVPRLLSRSEIEQAVSSSDVVLVDDEFRGASLELILAVARAIPGRVVLYASAYGLDSPNGHLCADELFLASLSGIASVTPEGFADRNAERPMQLYGNQASLLGGLTAAVAVLQAIRTARRTRVTQFIDFSVLDALNSVPVISQAAGFSGAALPEPPSERPESVPRGFQRCKDGWIYTQGGDDNWPSWAALIGHGEWRDPPWSEPSYRQQLWGTIQAELADWLSARSAVDVYRACQGLGITAFPVNSTSQVLNNAQIQERELVESFQAFDGTMIRGPRTPIRIYQD